MLWLRKCALRIEDQVNAEELDRLLDRLDFDAVCHERLYGSRRQHRRYTHRAHGVAIEICQDGQSTTLIASTRNLSAGGLGFLCSGPLSPGTPCTIRLLDLAGSSHVIPAKVAHCRPVQNRLFEGGVVFDQHIGVSEFLSHVESTKGTAEGG